MQHHAADLEMLAEKAELYPAFHNTIAKAAKPIDCVKVDGGMDEGPSHEEVKFLWTEWHLKQKKAVTVVTAQSAGSSYMNRVELQNGCCALGHSNLFIPSTLTGGCLDASSHGGMNQEALNNLEAAIEVYIKEVDGSPCGDTQIKLYKGSKDKRALTAQGPVASISVRQQEGKS